MVSTLGPVGQSLFHVPLDQNVYQTINNNACTHVFNAYKLRYTNRLPAEKPLGYGMGPVTIFKTMPSVTCMKSRRRAIQGPTAYLINRPNVLLKVCLYARPLV